MGELVRTGGEAVIMKDGPIAAVASTCSQVVLATSHRDMGQRSSREARTLCRALDLPAKRETRAAAEPLCQRPTAVEKSLADQGPRTWAEFLEQLRLEGKPLVG